MAKAGFRVSLFFEGLTVDREDGDVIAAQLRQIANDTAAGAMCSQWRQAFLDGQTEVSDLVLSEPEPHVFNVTVRPSLVTRISVTGASNLEDAQAQLYGYLRDTVEYSGDFGNYSFDEGGVSVELEPTSDTAPADEYEASGA